MLAPIPTSATTNSIPPFLAGRCSSAAQILQNLSARRVGWREITEPLSKVGPISLTSNPNLVNKKKKRRHTRNAKRERTPHRGPWHEVRLLVMPQLASFPGG